MHILSFNIEKNRSYADGSLAISIETENLHTGLTADLLIKSAVKNEKNAALFLIQEELSYLSRRKGKPVSRHAAHFNTVHVCPANSQEALKLLAGTGKLFFAKKRLVCDFFSPAEFYYRVDAAPGSQTSISGVIKTNDKDFNISECDFISPGPPHFFIKGIVLKFLKTEIFWKDLKLIYEDRSQISLRDIKDRYGDEQAEGFLSPGIVYTGDAEIRSQQQLTPMPLLVLRDRLGSFADLWMTYDLGEPFGKIKIHVYDPSPYIKNDKGKTIEKRQQGQERHWEQDLLETDFIKKTAGTSHYYCPLEKVGKSLAFLLELGWEVLDWEHRQVMHQSKLDLKLTSSAETILIKGRVSYGDFETDIGKIAGAFNRRETFVQLGTTAVGLIPPDFGASGLTGAYEEGEIVHDGIQIARNRFGTLSDLFETHKDLICDDALTDLKERLQNFEKIEESLPGEGFHGKLRPYQQQGLNWLSFLYAYGFHGLLADDMGLGKTIEILAFLSRQTAAAPVLIIMPTSLIFNWKREIQTFLPSKKVFVHHGESRAACSNDLAASDIILTSYSTLRLDLPLFLELCYDCIILDEAQNIKNARTQIAQAIYQLKGRFRLSLTGTPIENHLNELWSHFRFLMPGLLGEEKGFEAETQASIYDSRHLQKIRKKIRPFLLRRTKDEVAKDLPERFEQVMWVEMNAQQRQLYDDYLAGVKGGLLKKVEREGVTKHRLEILEAILRLRQICCDPLLVIAGEDISSLPPSSKLDLLIQDLETIREEKCKALVYSQFTSMLALIAKQLNQRGWTYSYLDGSTKDREQPILQFQENPQVSIFLISLKAGGAGLNLTAADYVLLYDPWWNDAVENQAIDRAHRIGREGKVIAKRYAIVESIEEKMMKLKEAKRASAAGILTSEVSNLNIGFEDLAFLFS